MNRPLSVAALVTLLGSLLAATGCGPGLKERVALLEEENTQLLGELDQTRTEGQQARGDRDLCEQELSTLRADNDGLRNQLAEARSKPAEPTAPEGWTPIPGGAMIALDGEVLFRSGKADLRTEARRTLDKIAQALNSEYAAQDVLVYGHTDGERIKKSGWKDNLELSAQRALAVVRHLQSRGVTPARLVGGGCGEHRPMAPNTSAANQARNRRVEIYVLDNVVRSARR